MKLKHLITIIVFLFALSWINPVQAKDSNAPNVIDDANLLSKGEMTYLENLIDTLGSEYSVDAVILTIDDNLGKSLQEYAEMFYEENQYGYGTNKDGMIFVISTETYDWRITTWGYCSEIIDDEHYNQIETEIIPLLEEANYNKAFINYLMELNGFFKDHTRSEVVPDAVLVETENTYTGVFIWATIALLGAFSMITFQKRRFQKKAQIDVVEPNENLKGTLQMIKQEDNKTDRKIIRDE